MSQVVRRANLRAELSRFSKQFSKAHLSVRDLDNISDALLAAHKPLIIKPFRSLINPEAIIKGVRCPECGAMPMEKLKQSWICPHCEHTSRTAHLLA